MFFKNKNTLLTYTYLTAIFLCLAPALAYSQVKEQPYNRFQYHSFKWRTFHSDAYHIYFPFGHDSTAKYIAGELPEAMERVKHRMVTSLLEIPNVIIYPSPDQLYQSNIGLYDFEDKTLPTFVKKGNRMVLFFNGNHDDLKAQLYEALVRSIWEAQFNNELEDQAKGGVNEAIPFWFTEGAIRYFAHHWPVQAEDEFRRSFENKHFNNWHEVIAYQPRLSGQAFCYFLSDRFYEEAPAQLFGQLKKKRDLRRSIRLIAKKELDSLCILCFDYYKNKFSREDATRDTTGKTIPHKKGIVRQVLTEPGMSTTTYVLSRNNKRTIYSYNSASGKTTKISTYKLPPWINDYSKDNYPLVTYREREGLLITQPKKGIIIVGQTAITGIDGITSVQLDQNGSFLMSGYRKGQSDIVSFDVNRGQYTAHTSDIYDDTYLANNTTKKLYFLSSRPHDNPGDTTKPPMAQGIYSVEGKLVQQLVTDTLPYIKWSKPLFVSHNELLATHTRYGVERFALVNTSSSAVKTLGRYKPIQYLSSANEIVSYSTTKDSISIISEPLRKWINNYESTDTTSPWLQDYRKREALRAKEDSILLAAKENDKYSFLKDILVPKDAQEQAANRKDSVEQSLQYNPKKVRAYILQLHSAYFAAKANNDYFINRYQPCLNYQGQFKFPEIGAMLQAGFTDLFENHHVGISFRIPTQTEGSDFYLNYRNTKKNLDWGLTYFRKVETVQPDPQRAWVNESGQLYPGLAKVKTHYYELSLQYPITYYLSIGLDQTFRNDRTIFLATEKYSLVFEDIKSLWSITTLSVKQNKLRPTIPLLYRGYSAKLLVDGFKAFTQNGDALYGVNAKVQYHQPLYRYITLVTQLQAGHSGGASHLLYNVAGIDNNVNVKVDSTVHFSQTAPYAFQMLITPFRGYRQNTLFGNQYAVWNNDVYFPLFQTLIPIETPLSVINNLQLGLFSDIGTAKETWQKPQVKDGLFWSYGMSARSKLAGYPIRVDVAWPGTFSKRPLWYFSLGAQ